jgi:hypothetical protein
MNRLRVRNSGSRRLKRFIKSLLLVAVFFLCVDIYRKMKIGDDTDQEASQSIFERLFGKLPLFGDEIDKFEPNSALYNVEEKMFAEMGLRPREWKFYEVSHDLKHSYGGKRTGNFQFTPSPELIFEPDEFVKPWNIFKNDSLGENGVGVEMPAKMPDNIQKLYNEGWEKHEFNKYLSDLISFHRKLPDYRTDYCLEMEKNYSKTLPPTSVIIIYNNEAWSTLLRSVHSVLDRSPDHLIEEIILVDDFSDMGELKLLFEYKVAMIRFQVT